MQTMLEILIGNEKKKKKQYARSFKICLNTMVKNQLKSFQLDGINYGK